MFAINNLNDPPGVSEAAKTFYEKRTISPGAVHVQLSPTRRTTILLYGMRPCRHGRLRSPIHNAHAGTVHISRWYMIIRAIRLCFDCLSKSRLYLDQKSVELKILLRRAVQISWLYTCIPILIHAYIVFQPVVRIVYITTTIIVLYETLLKPVKSRFFSNPAVCY